MRSVNGIDFQTASGNELFVLGRNIYQAADGNCYACHRFIDGFSENSKIPTQAKLHILNGMAYEIYFDSSNKIRNAADDGNTEVFYFKNGVATISSFTHEPKVIKF